MAIACPQVTSSPLPKNRQPQGIASTKNPGRFRAVSWTQCLKIRPSFVLNLSMRNKT